MHIIDRDNIRFFALSAMIDRLVNIETNDENEKYRIIE